MEHQVHRKPANASIPITERVDVLKLKVEQPCSFDRIESLLMPLEPAKSLDQHGSDFHGGGRDALTSSNPNFKITDLAREVGLRLIEDLLVPTEQVSQIHGFRFAKEAPQKSRMGQ
jgi:hypothetical protein